MAGKNVRGRLDELIAEHGETYASVSRLLGHNASYVQQFIKRGSPVHLSESDIARLALHFDVSPNELGGKVHPRVGRLTPITTPVVAPRDGRTTPKARLIDRVWLERLTEEPAGVELVVVDGAAMSPTVNDGDEALIQRLGRGEPLRDGLYAIDGSKELLIRRIAREPTKNRISVLTDNPAYPNWNGLQRRNVKVAGRVIWLGKRP